MVLEQNVKAPVEEGQKLGEMKYKIQGETIASCNLVATKNIEKINFLTTTKNVYSTWLNLLR